MWCVHDTYIASINCCIFIGTNRGSHWITSTSSQTAGQLVLKDDKFIYIPILETLQQLLCNKSVLTEVNNLPACMKRTCLTLLAERVS